MDTSSSSSGGNDDRPSLAERVLGSKSDEPSSLAEQWPGDVARGIRDEQKREMQGDPEVPAAATQTGPKEGGLLGTLKQGWEDLKHGGAVAPRATTQVGAFGGGVGKHEGVEGEGKCKQEVWEWGGRGLMLRVRECMQHVQGRKNVVLSGRWLFQGFWKELRAGVK